MSLTFLKAGDDVKSSGSATFMTLKEDESVKVTFLHGVNPPKGEAMNGRNCMVNFMQYAIWLDNLPDGVRSPVFPQLVDPWDPGKLLTDPKSGQPVKAKFRGMAIVANESGEEKILAMTKALYDQLVEIESMLKSTGTANSIQGYKILIKRVGKNINTKYHAMQIGPDPKFDQLDEPELNLMEWVGATTVEEIATMLKAVEPYAPETLKTGIQNVFNKAFPVPVAPPTSTAPVPATDPVIDGPAEAIGEEYE